MELTKTIHIKDLENNLLIQLQTNLKKLGFYTGEIDGIYGPNTLAAWTDWKTKSGIGQKDLLPMISQSSWELLESETNSATVHDFSSKKGTINAIIWECNRLGLTLKSQHAYVVATVEHETAGSFKPVEEGFYLGAKAKAFQRSLRYYPYYGRGYVQLTWKANYQKYAQILGIDLVGKPELACNPNVALFVLVHGFKTGAFTGKKLEQYVNNRATDFVGSRRCINGVDRADYIAQIARGWMVKI